MSQLNETYYIAPGAVRITPNAISVDGDAHRYVAISVTTGTLIMLSVSHYSESLGINYTSGLNNPTWRLVGYSTQLNAEYNDKVVYIYARLEVGAANGILILSPNDYTTSETGSEQTAVKRGDYIFVKLGYLTAPVEGLRSLQFDSGCLLTQYGNDLKENNLEGFFSLVGNAIQPLKNFVELTINKTLTVSGTLTTKILSLAGKTVKGIDDSKSTSSSDDHLATSGYVDANSLSSKADDTAQGKITFSQGINIGAQDITDIDTSDESLNTTKDNSLPTSKAVVRYVDDSTLSSKTEDTAKGKITFENGLKVGNYAPGVADGTGGAMEVSEEGVVTTTDYLNVRRKARFNEVEILTTHHIGGAQMSSAASCKIDHVVTRVDGVYQCFFRKTDADGRTITNDWKKGDQAYCNTFNLQEQADGTKGNHYFWRLVVSTDAVTGTLTSDLGETFNADEYHCVWMAMAMNNCAEGSDAPIAGDEVVLLGHQPQSGEIEADCAGRQSAIYQVASGTDGRPYYRQYVGINSFSLEGCLEQQLMPNDNILSGKLVIKEGSTGWENFEGLNETLDGALNGIQDTNSRVDNLSFSNTNLLRNSGFYGDTKSKAILGDTMMSTDTELYSPSLEYWTVSNAVAYPSDANEEGAETTPTITDSKSGYYCKLNNGYISQIIGTALVDEDYIISFRGKGDFTIGFVGNTEKVTLTDTTSRHIIRCKARTTTVNAILRIEGTGSICEIMLERGNIPSNTWNRSTLDASKELSRFHNLEYLTQAIQEGSTTMMGGLILSNILMLGNYVDGIMKQVTSGISGTYNQGDDVSYWAGGSLENAIYTATKLLKNPFYQFTEAEKKNLANAIITHGGTAIFNEAIVRGIVYATNGIFSGEVNATSGTFNNVVINDNVVIRGKFNRVVQYITQENFEDFFYTINSQFDAFHKTGEGFDNNSISALPTYMHAWADILYWNGNNEITMALPCIYKYTSYDDATGISKILTKPIIGKVKDNGVSRDMEYNDVMSLVGREIVLFNNTDANINIYASLIKPANYGTEEDATYKTIIIDPVNSTGKWFHGYTNLTDTNDKNPSISRYIIGGQNATILKCVMVRRYLQDTYQGEEVSGYVDMIGWILTRFDRQLS